MRVVLVSLSEDFGEKLIKRLSKVVEGKQRASYSGAGIREHDEDQATID